jgi:hypothetical protein
MLLTLPLHYIIQNILIAHDNKNSKDIDIVVYSKEISDIIFLSNNSLKKEYCSDDRWYFTLEDLQNTIFYENIREYDYLVDFDNESIYNINSEGKAENVLFEVVNGYSDRYTKMITLKSLKKYKFSVYITGLYCIDVYLDHEVKLEGSILSNNIDNAKEKLKTFFEENNITIHSSTLQVYLK